MLADRRNMVWEIIPSTLCGKKLQNQKATQIIFDLHQKIAK